MTRSEIHARRRCRWVKLIVELQAAPRTARELRRLVGMGEEAVMLTLRGLHGAGLIHVSGYRDDAAIRPPRLWAWGPGVDAVYVVKNKRTAELRAAKTVAMTVDTGPQVSSAAVDTLLNCWR